MIDDWNAIADRLRTQGRAARDPQAHLTSIADALDDVITEALQSVDLALDDLEDDTGTPVADREQRLAAEHLKLLAWKRGVLASAADALAKLGVN